MGKVISAPFVRSPYNYDVNAASDESGLKCLDKSLTVQSEAEDADINTIVERFGLTGQLPSNVRMPTSGDFTGVASYHDACNLAIAADEAFMQFPAEVRKRFNHDPAELMAFVEDAANRDEAIRLGLVVPPAAAAAAPISSAATADGATKAV